MTWINLQLFFTVHVVFFRLDKDSLFSSPDEVGELPVLSAEDHPEITKRKKRNTLVNGPLLLYSKYLHLSLSL